MDYTEMQREIFRVKKACPNIRVQIYGRSVLGKRLYALQMGQGRNKILFAGAFHGMEHITSRLLMRFVWDFCEDGGINWDLLKCRLVVVPMVNPDGVDIQIGGWRQAGCCSALVKRVSGGNTERWQANARGVDLNHNFDAGWCDLRERETEAGITGPAMTRFGGYYPESEKESHALASFVRNQKFCMALAFHTQGEEIYWDYGKCTPHESYDMAKAMAEVSGYTVSSPEGLASGGGFKDWFIECFRRPGFTIEAGKGQNPLPESDFDEIYERLKPLMIQALKLCC